MISTLVYLKLEAFTKELPKLLPLCLLMPLTLGANILLSLLLLWMNDCAPM